MSASLSTVEFPVQSVVHGRFAPKRGSMLCALSFERLPLEMMSTAEDESDSLRCAGDAGSDVQMGDECMAPNTPIRPMIGSFRPRHQTTEDHV